MINPPTLNTLVMASLCFAATLHHPPVWTIEIESNAHNSTGLRSPIFGRKPVRHYAGELCQGHGDGLRELEARQDELNERLPAASADLPDIHHSIADLDLYQRKVALLADPRGFA